MWNGDAFTVQIHGRASAQGTSDNEEWTIDEYHVDECASNADDSDREAAQQADEYGRLRRQLIGQPLCRRHRSWLKGQDDRRRVAM
jgi:hypothetical protein